MNSEFSEELRTLFRTLDPNGDGKVHKNTLKYHLQKTYGHIYEDQVFENIVEGAIPDEEGMISVEGYCNGFSMPNCSVEQVAHIREVFQNSPDVLKKLVDCKELAESLGFKDEKEVESVIAELSSCYLDSMKLRLENDAPQMKALTSKKKELKKKRKKSRSKDCC